MSCALLPARWHLRTPAVTAGVLLRSLADTQRGSDLSSCPVAVPAKRIPREGNRHPLCRIILRLPVSLPPWPPHRHRCGSWSPVPSACGTRTPGPRSSGSAGPSAPTRGSWWRCLCSPDGTAPCTSTRRSPTGTAGLQGCGDFVGRLQRVVDGPVPCSVVNHRVSIAPPRVSGSRELTCQTQSRRPVMHANRVSLIAMTLTPSSIVHVAWAVTPWW